MESGRRTRTRLQRVLTQLGLKSLHVVAMAKRLSAELARPSISRQQFFRLKGGRAVASEEKIFIIVAAMRELTGIAFHARDLFDVEPMLVFSGSHSPRTWRVFVPDEPGSRAEEPFEQLYRQYGVLLRSIAMRRFGVPPDDAEALVHDTFVAYLERHTIIRDVKRWLMGAVGNASKNYWRARKREAPLLPEHEETADAAAEAETEQRMRRSAAVAVLAQLGPKCRETLRRYYLGEESKEVIAGKLSTSPGYVLQLLIACRRRAHEVFCTLMGRRK